ncbi:MAG: twin-arginine translocation signal domain-containing protein, partial [Betaproteobacteria bacterium]
MSRRRFIQACGACVSAVTALVSGCVSIFRPGDSTEVAPPLNCAAPGDGDA